MSAIQAPDLPKWEFPSVSQEDLSYADLAVIDLSEAKTPDGRQRLAEQITEAMHNEGFFYVVNHGYTQEQTDRIFSIGNVLFDGVDEEEKLRYTDRNPDVYEGYKIRKLWELAPGVTDSIEHYNVHRQVRHREHPNAVRPYLDELDEFLRHNHIVVLYTILRIMAIGLQMPEETLADLHKFDGVGQASARFIKYHSRSEVEEEKAKNVWLKGHTDEGTVSLLWSQPIGGLQILTRDNEWKWVRHMPNALVVNSGDALGFLCGGYYPPTRHRVVQPPKDQRGRARLGTFYFGKPNDDVTLAPLRKESRILREEWDIKSEYDPVEPPTMEMWRKGRVMSYGQVKLRQGSEKNVEEEVVAGVVVKHFN